MKSYLDNIFIVADNTIISYMGKVQSIIVPQTIDGIPVSRIGSGAFMELNDLKKIEIPKKFTEIGDKAFANCPCLEKIVFHKTPENLGNNLAAYSHNLNTIILQNLEIDHRTYLNLKGSCIKCTDGTYIAKTIPDIPPIYSVFNAFNIKPASEVPSGASSVFQLSQLNESSVYEKYPVIGFSEPCKPISEDSAIRERIKNGKSSFYDAFAEKQNDLFVRKNKPQTITKTCLFSFDDTSTKKDTDKITVNAVLKIGIFFWQSYVKIVYDDKTYYIYQRNYLNSVPECKYIRRDITIYSEGKILNDCEEAKKIYAKYKLLSII